MIRQGRHGHAVFPPRELHHASQDDGDADGQKNQDQVITGARRADAETFDGHAHQGDSRHGRGKGQGHGQPAAEKSGKKKHATQ